MILKIELRLNRIRIFYVPFERASKRIEPELFANNKHDAFAN